MELVSRMMDGSISYDPKARLEPVSSGATVKQGDKIERLFDAPAGTMLTRASGRPKSVRNVWGARRLGYTARTATHVRTRGKKGL